MKTLKGKYQMNGRSRAWLHRMATKPMAALVVLLVGLAVSRGSGIGPIALSALTKFATGAVAVVWSVAYAAEASHARQRLGRLAATGGVALLLAVILWWPWLQTASAFAPLQEAAGGRLVLSGSLGERAQVGSQSP